MAVIQAVQVYRQDLFNLGLIYANRTSSKAWDDAPRDIFGRVYNDDWALAYSYEGAAGAISFAGMNLQMTNTKLIGGDVSGVIYQTYDGNAYLDARAIHDVSLSGRKIWEALKSSETTDDLALTKAMFSGSDQFSLSRGKDVAFGYDGKDTFSGKGGNDVLWGGKGADVLSGGRWRRQAARRQGQRHAHRRK